MKLQNDLGEIRISSEVFTGRDRLCGHQLLRRKGMAVRSKTATRLTPFSTMMCSSMETVPSSL